jgi:phospholipid-transporting ATPase
LDGETNLKTRSPLLQTAGILTEDQFESLEAVIECESPNRILYEFTGNIRLGGGSNIALRPDQLLLRGSRLKNCEWVFGISVFTGHDSKLMQNSKKGAILLLKRSQLDEFANRQIVIMFGVLLIVCVISGTGNAIWRQFHTSRDWYLHPFLENQNFGFNFLTFFILYNNLIPISLQVSLEMVRFFQTLFISWVSAPPFFFHLEMVSIG